MREIEIQGLGRIQIPDQWGDVEIKMEILRLRSLPTITIDHTDEHSPKVTGDVEPLKPIFEAYCKWGPDGFWHTEPRHVESIRQAERNGRMFRIKEILPKVAPPQKPAVKETASKQTTTPAGKREANTPAGPSVVSGTIEQVFAPPNTATPMRQVKILTADGKKPTLGCFKHDLFAELDKAKGAIEVYVTKTVKGDKTFFNIVGLKRLGNKEWLEDGTPCIQRDREAGPTLFKP